MAGFWCGAPCLIWFSLQGCVCMELGACLSCGRGPGTTSRSSFYRRSVFGGCCAFRFFACFSRTVDVAPSAFGIPHGEEAENFPPGPRDLIISSLRLLHLVIFLCAKTPLVFLPRARTQRTLSTRALATACSSSSLLASRTMSDSRPM